MICCRRAVEVRAEDENEREKRVKVEGGRVAVDEATKGRLLPLSFTLHSTISSTL